MAYKMQTVKQIINECALFLERTQQNDLAARKWKSYWKAATSMEATGEMQRLDPLIDSAVGIAWKVAMALFIIEIVMTHRSADIRGRSRRTDLKVPFSKQRRYIETLSSTGLGQDAVTMGLLKRISIIESDPSANIDSGELMKVARQALDEAVDDAASIVETIEPMIAESGQICGRHDYSYLLFYDIVDSTATQVGRAGTDVKTYRDSVRKYKELLNVQFHRLAIQAKKDEAEIYCWNGNKGSENDCKHVFFSGKFALRHVYAVLKALLDSCHAFDKIRVRTYVVACNFAGTGAYRREPDTEISGERFWEHWSRVCKKCPQFEQQCSRGKSFLLVASEQLVEAFRLPEGLTWSDPADAEIVSEIELLSMNTKVRYGAISGQKAR